MKKTANPYPVILIQKLIECCDEYKRGTYNQQDPTQYIKSRGDFYYKGKEYHVECNDVCWGVEIKIRTDVRIVGECYLDTDTGTPKFKKKMELIYRDIWRKGTWNLIHDIVKSVWYEKNEARELSRKEENEMWIDPSGGVHFGYDGDPAAMYE